MNKYVELVFWDVQHGHSTYIKSPNNRHIVIDLGIGDYSGNNQSFSPLLYLKQQYNIQQLDYVIITHPHLDHIDDILNFELLRPKVLNRPSTLTNDEIMKGVRDNDRAKFEKYCEINNRYSTPITDESIDNPSNPSNWGGLKISSFIPINCSHDNFNNFSIVTVIEYAEIKVVIPGDNEKCSFDELLLSETFKKAIREADILLAPHHGRDSGYYLDFLNLVNPRLTVVSDGRFCDTSANSKYSAKSRGWKVHKKSNGTSYERKCLTTNSDGQVYVKFGYEDGDQRFLQVSIE